MGELAPVSARSEGPPAGPTLVEIGTPSRKRAERATHREETENRFRPDVYWYLTFRCNLACAHCSVQSSPWVDNSGDLTTEECLQTVEKMAELNARAVYMSGGEVLIRPDALTIMRALGEKGILIGLETNGLRFDKAFVEVARDLQEKNLLVMTISLDGGTRETHERLRGPRSFERTVRGLRFLNDNGIRFNVQCVLNGTNIETIPDLYELANELWPFCRMVQFASLNPVGRGTGLVHEIGLRPQHINSIFKLIDREQDGFPGFTLVKVPPAMVPPRYLPLVFKQPKMRNTMSCQFPLLGVLPNGDVTICAVSRNDEDLYFGNVRDPDLSLKEIWQRARMTMVRSRYLASQDLQGICSDCLWKYSCKGGCRAWAYEEGGSFDAPFPVCKTLDEAGAFPKVYRLSLQNAAAIQKFQQMQVGCSCSSA